MNKLILNIGVKSNNGTTNNVDKMLETLRELFDMHPYLLSVQSNDAKSDWGEEQTILIRVEDIILDLALFSNIQQLCTKFNQDCIAISYNGEGQLIFNGNYKGERFEFNPDYFITF